MPYGGRRDTRYGASPYGAEFNPGADMYGEDWQNAANRYQTAAVAGQAPPLGGQMPSIGQLISQPTLTTHPGEGAPMVGMPDVPDPAGGEGGGFLDDASKWARLLQGAAAIGSLGYGIFDNERARGRGSNLADAIVGGEARPKDTSRYPSTAVDRSRETIERGRRRPLGITRPE